MTSITAIVYTDPRPITKKLLGIESKLFKCYNYSVMQFLGQPITTETIAKFKEYLWETIINEMPYITLVDITVVDQYNFIKSVIGYKVNPHDVLYEMLIEKG